MELTGKRILVGVCGGIAAYKAAEVARKLVKAGAEVSVVMTANATRFVTPLTFRTLTSRPVATDLFSDPGSPVPHISLATWPDLIIVVPATADLISRAAAGRANDLLAAILLDTPAPVLMAPAMNSRMWRHRATQANLEKLRSWGMTMVSPGRGDLACGEIGEGRLAEVDEIVAAVRARFQPSGPLAGKHVLITAGPTREAWDAIRFLSNRSSGKMGYALAAEAQRRGAKVMLISGPVSLIPPAGVDFRSVENAQEMEEAALAAYPKADVVIAAAAVADYKPEAPQEIKIKKTSETMSIPLVPTPDILKKMGEQKTHQLLVGFAAENEDPLRFGLEKMRRKHCDLMISNYASGPQAAFNQEKATIFMLDEQQQEQIPSQSKTVLAGLILDRVEQHLMQRKS